MYWKFLNTFFKVIFKFLDNLHLRFGIACLPFSSYNTFDLCWASQW